MSRRKKKHLAGFTYTGKKMTKAQERDFISAINNLRKNFGKGYIPDTLENALKPMVPMKQKSKSKTSHKFIVAITCDAPMTRERAKLRLLTCFALRKPDGCGFTIQLRKP
jgi:hypothetical protein